MNEKEYEKIKTLLDAGLKQSQVSELTGRSTATVFYIKKSSDMKDYQRILAERSIVKKEKNVHVESVELVDVMRRIDNKLNMQVSLLEKLVEQTSKKKWF